MNELLLIENIDMLYSNLLYFYGASNLGKETLEMVHKFGLDIEAFGDSNINKVGMSWCGKIVYSIEDIAKKIKQEKAIIIITSIYIKEIIHIFKVHEIQLNKVFTVFALRYSIILNINNKIIPDELRKINLNTFKIWINRQKEKYSVYYNEVIDKLLNTKNEQIWVYQAGKVGSSSIEKTLLEYGLNVSHYHSIVYNESLQSFYSKKDYNEFISNIIKNNHIKIISLVREPIARDISLFFQEFDWPYMYLLKGKLNSNLCLSCIQFLKEYTYQKDFNSEKGFIHWSDNIAYYGNRGIQFDWFDTEIKQLFKIDVYKYPFDCEMGYSIIKFKNIEILLMQLEKLNTLEDIIGDFVGIKNFKLKSFNDSEDKLYSIAYQELLNNIELPEEYINFYYKNNSAVDHFYNKYDRKKFEKKWR